MAKKISETYVLLFRGLTNKAFYKKDSEKVHLWIHILMTANWSEKEEYLGGKKILCKPGQFTTGRKQLAKETGISESKIERILSNFEKIEQQIEQQKTSTNRLITVLNWEQYQVSEQPFEQRVNNERTTSEQRVNTPKEYKKERIKEKKEREVAIKIASPPKIDNFKNSLFPFCKSKGGLYSDETVKEFFEYWSELNKSGTKMRWELQKTFEVKKRLVTWANNDLKFNRNGKNNNGTRATSDNDLLNAIAEGVGRAAMQ